jgi:hypothetical protein
MGIHSSGVKKPVSEATYSSPPSTEVKSTWSYTTIPIQQHGVVLDQERKILLLLRTTTECHILEEIRPVKCGLSHL